MSGMDGSVRCGKEKMRKLKKTLKKAKKGAKRFLARTGCMLGVLFCKSIPVSAAAISTGIPEVDNILSVIATLLLGVVAGIGLIITIKNIGDTAQAYQQQDSHGMYDGAKGIAAGAIMVFIGPILKLFGII